MNTPAVPVSTVCSLLEAHEQLKTSESAGSSFLGAGGAERNRRHNNLPCKLGGTSYQLPERKCGMLRFKCVVKSGITLHVDIRVQVTAQEVCSILSVRI